MQKDLSFSRSVVVRVMMIGTSLPYIAACQLSGDDSGYHTLLSEPGELSIVRRPEAANFGRKRLEKLPTFEPSSTEAFQVDLRGYDLSALDLSDKREDLLHADFDDVTKWPSTLPEGFDPVLIAELGKNPGLNVRALHRRGITGKGIGLAIIDQALLTEHAEYADRLRLYEEIHVPEQPAQMHGPAVASIAVGKTVGVAPEADLYYIAETHGIAGNDGFEWDFVWLAQAIDRVAEINAGLPSGNKIRVISISVGWSSDKKGYAEVTAAVRRAQAAGLFVVSSAISQSYDARFFFHGLGRSPLSDPDSAASYTPGSWWASKFFEGTDLPPTMLLIPMDARATASPTGANDYVFYAQGGWSWSIPYIAGLYALASQVAPNVTPDLFWAAALKTGTSLEIPRDGKTYVLEKIVNPVALVDELVGSGG